MSGTTWGGRSSAGKTMASKVVIPGSMAQGSARCEERRKMAILYREREERKKLSTQGEDTAESCVA